MINIPRHPRTGQYIIGVDFDGTLCQNAWPDIGPPNMALIETLHILQKRADTYLMLYTARTGERLMEARMWCRTQGLHFNETKGGKPWMSILIDDKTLRPEEAPLSLMLPTTESSAPHVDE